MSYLTLRRRRPLAGILLAGLLTLSCTACAGLDRMDAALERATVKKARLACSRYGYHKRTEAFSDCVSDEVNAERDRESREWVAQQRAADHDIRHHSHRD